MAHLSSSAPRFVSFFVGALVAGCGGSPPPPPTAPTAPTSVASVADAGGPAAVDVAGPAVTAPVMDAAPPPPPGSKKITKKSDPAWAACHASFKAGSKDLSAEVGKMAKGCAQTTKMKQVGQTTKGTQSEASPHQEIKLKGEAKHCYRVYAESDPTIKDLDLLLKDSNGDIAAEDSTDDTNPVLVEDGAFCFTEADNAVVIVSVGMGKGNYAVQIWGD